MSFFDRFRRSPAPAEPVPAPAPAPIPVPPPPVAPAVAAVPAPAPDAPADNAPQQSWKDRLRQGLTKTRDFLGQDVRTLFATHKFGSEEREELETLLLTADVGVAATEHLLDDLQDRWVKSNGKAAPVDLLKQSLCDLMFPLEKPLVIGDARPFVIMIAGVNGAGKTTSIGKLAKWLQRQHYSVLLAAGDTFRAAAREQLQTWGERNNVTVISQEGGDPAAVVFDAINAAKARGIDVVIADTAGRLPTQLHLMDELKKVKRVIAKAEPTAPHEALLVLDANTGQNALAQVKAFDEAIGLTGLVMTKLDGTAKGGVVAALAKTQPVPLRFIGVGEGIDDLRPFKALDYVEAMID